MEELKQGELISPDFSELKTSIDLLVETMGKELELRELEKKEQQEKEELLLKEQQEKEEQLLKDDLVNEESISEFEKAESEYKAKMATLQEDQITSIDTLIGEIQTLNENTLVSIEKMDTQNDLIVEGSLTLVITIVVVAAVKVFIDQVTKW